MGDIRVNVDAGNIEKAAKDLDQFGKDLQQEVEKMQAKVQGFGAPWGGDEIGMLIGITHQVVSEFGFDKLTELAGDMDADAKAADHIAKALRGNETAGSKRLEKAAEI